MSRTAWDLAVRPQEVVRDLAEMHRRLARGVDTLSRIRAEDITVSPTPKEEIWRDGKVALYRFTAPESAAPRIPVLIVYALVNRPYMVDLQEDRSLVRNLLARGLDVYLIDWGYPGPADRWLTLEDYIEGFVDDCVDVLCERHGVDRMNILGICQGGTFSLCYAALHPEKVGNLITMVTPVDFHRKEGLLNVWAQYADVDLMVDALGNIPGEFMNFGFLMLRPWALNMRKYIDLLDILDDEKELMNFLRMEKWLADRPHHPGEAAKQWLKDLYQENKLIQGELVIGGETVDLANIHWPALLIAAERDHITPLTTTLPLFEHISSTEREKLVIPAGHVGLVAGRGAVNGLWPQVSGWLADHSD
jgi:polyhydroxyalkanoate synthase